MSDQLRLFPDGVEEAEATNTQNTSERLPDQDARDYATNPQHDVVLEASAGTGKTTVLVNRYVNLLRRGVKPSNILAITFTRKAAAEMRERIIRELKRGAALSPVERARWNALRDRLSEIDISTIDAFCLGLLREFPLEAGLEPGFSMADETEVPRLVEESLDGALRICMLRAREDEELALVLAQLGINRARVGLAHLLQRRLVAWPALDRFLAAGPAELTVRDACGDVVQRLRDTLHGLPGGVSAFVKDGPVLHPRFRLLARDLLRLDALRDEPPAVVRGAMERVRRHFLKTDGEPRTSAGQLRPYRNHDFDSAAACERHRDAVTAVAPRVKNALDAFARDLNVLLARGVRRMFLIALNEYRRTLRERSVLDFSDVLEHALGLLAQMEEFSRSRYRLESRYHHVLVDEFQDTSRAQWQLISLLIQAWGEGSGVAADSPLSPSIFVVGDRKQSIYRFRDAEVTVLQEAGDYIAALRPDRASPRRAIAFSFRARPELLAFVNDLFDAIDKVPGRPDAFRFDEIDRFPLRVKGEVVGGATPLGVVSAETPESCAAAVADEIVAILHENTVRDRDTGVSRPARPGDIAILFRSRASHREFEQALEARGIPTYVYKGLGFFDADETKDLVALLRFLADPSSDVRAAAFLRSRFVHISDEALCRLAPRLAAALTERAPVAAPGSQVFVPAEPEIPDLRTREPQQAQVHKTESADRGISPDDLARLERARASVAAWLHLADRVPPAELLDRVLADSAYDYELRGPRRAQARENLKKLRSLVRRIQNRGYATLRRIAEHLDSLSAGDESNATLEAVDAVNLMTVHAAKGLEFPIVFIVNLAKGSGGAPSPVRVIADTPNGVPSVSVASYISEADEDSRTRESEETKRLLYVAVTRARDALYLATVTKEGEIRPTKGSLGEVLPPSVRGLFSASVKSDKAISWQGPSGQRHAFRNVSAGAETPAIVRPRADLAVTRDVFGPLAVRADVPRIAATTFVASTAAARGGTESAAGSRGDAVIGTVVHRMFQARVPAGNKDEAARAARRLLRPEDRVRIDDEETMIQDAAATYMALASHEEVARILASGSCHYEVPFSVIAEPVAGGVLGQADLTGRAIVRGTIDCLVRRSDGSVFVLEFKTGRPRPEHQRQLEIYVSAVRAMFSGSDVTGAVIYP